MDHLKQNISKSLICIYCQTNIKNLSEVYFCEICNSPYHKDCWIENKGCAVYGCSGKLTIDGLNATFTSSIDEILINIEYLINKNEFEQAVHECSKLLKIDRRNSKAKNFYNKSVSLVNQKIKFLESGEEAFINKDYKTAEIFFLNALKFANENETNLINAKLDVIKLKIPELRKRKIIRNILTSFIIVVILGTILSFGYYYIEFEDNREYAEIEINDDTSDYKKTELQISRYENFLGSYPDSELRAEAENKINFLSFFLAEKFYKDDWETSLKYYNKILGAKNYKAFKDLYVNIFNRAYKDYQNKIAIAKKLDVQSKFEEAKDEIKDAIEIIEQFPNSEIGSEQIKLQAKINLLNKKISSIIKAKDLEKEINEKKAELNKIKRNANLEAIDAVVEKIISTSLAIARKVIDNSLIAISSLEKEYFLGEHINNFMERKGNISIKLDSEDEVSIPYYKFTGLFDDSTSLEKESILQRLNYLQDQKSKIDSLLRVSL